MPKPQGKGLPTAQEIITEVTKEWETLGPLSLAQRILKRRFDERTRPIVEDEEAFAAQRDAFRRKNGNWLEEKAPHGSELVNYFVDLQKALDKGYSVKGKFEEFVAKKAGLYGWEKVEQDGDIGTFSMQIHGMTVGMKAVIGDVSDHGTCCWMNERLCRARAGLEMAVLAFENRIERCLFDLEEKIAGAKKRGAEKEKSEREHGS